MGDIKVERKDVDKKYKWDLTVIYPTQADFEREYSACASRVKAYSKYEKTITKSAKALYDAISELYSIDKLLNKLSITDSLTGINDRRGFLDSVKSIVNSQYNDGKRAMLVFADMDNLKQVNDIFGHKSGDFAIKSIAEILTKSFNDDDIIGRIGGDEFVAFAFLDDPTRPTVIRKTISELSEKLNESCGEPYYIDISLGISTFTCSPILNIEEVMHHADAALYENKKNKRASVVKK